MKEIRIIPKAKARFFEIQYIYETECTQRNLNTNHALALDLGINNLVTAVSNKGKTFNADVNGALNIMRKSSVVDVTILYSRGEVDTPIRIRIA